MHPGIAAMQEHLEREAYVTDRAVATALRESDDYSRMSVTVPAPTVRPPSRIAKRRPFSIAIG